MSKRRFRVILHCDDIVIELDERVIDVVDDEWRNHLYQLTTPEEIAAHVAYNLVVNKWRLSTLDGWADQPDSNARIVDTGEWDVTTDEVLL